MKTFIAVAGTAFLLAAPAFAAEEYQTGPALVLATAIPARDTGSAQYPRFNHAAAQMTQRLRLIETSSSESGVETLASGPVALGTANASIGLLAQR